MFRIHPAVIACVMLAGCGGGRDEAQPTAGQPAWRQPWQSDRPLPAWIKDASDGGTRFAAYGSAASRGGESRSQQRDRAMAAARDELARMVQVRVRSAVRDWLADSGSSVARFSESVSQQVSSEQVAGSVQRDEWVHDKTGELFVLVVVDAASVRAMAQAVAEAARTRVGSDPGSAHLRARTGSDAASAELDRLLSRP